MNTTFPDFCCTFFRIRLVKCYKFQEPKKKMELLFPLLCALPCKKLLSALYKREPANAFCQRRSFSIVCLRILCSAGQPDALLGWALKEKPVQQQIETDSSRQPEQKPVRLEILACTWRTYSNRQPERGRHVVSLQGLNLRFSHQAGTAGHYMATDVRGTCSNSTVDTQCSIRQALPAITWLPMSADSTCLVAGSANEGRHVVSL